MNHFKISSFQVKKVSVTRANGKRKRTSALVVVGNGQGSIGKNHKFIVTKPKFTIL